MPTPLIVFLASAAGFTLGFILCAAFARHAAQVSVPDTRDPESLIDQALGYAARHSKLADALQFQDCTEHASGRAEDIRAHRQAAITWTRIARDAFDAWHRQRVDDLERFAAVSSATQARAP